MNSDNTLIFSICRPLIFHLLFAMAFLGGTAHAIDFYGASVSDRELPTQFFNIGMYGIRPIVATVAPDSPASKFGLIQGDVIIAINGRSITKTSELTELSGDSPSVGIIRGLKRKRIKVSKALIKEGGPAQHAVAKTYSTESQTPSKYADSGAPIRLDDATLEKKFGKTTPEQRDELRRQNQQLIQQERNADAARKKRQAQEEKQQAEAKAAAEAEKKKQEALEEQRRAAAREEFRKRQLEESQRMQQERIWHQQQELNYMREKVNRLEQNQQGTTGKK